MNTKHNLPILFILFLLSGCCSLDPKQDRTYEAVSNRPKSYSRTYDYSYDKVYSAVMRMLKTTLHLGVDQKFTTQDVIYTSSWQGDQAFVNGEYAYLFRLEKVNEDHTKVTLKASGGYESISDTDMLDKYLPQELVYLKTLTQGWIFQSSQKGDEFPFDD